MEESLAKAYHNRPELKALLHALDAAEVKKDLAGMPPNPEAGVAVDNLGGSRPEDDVTETTLSLSQTIELGGKAATRKGKANADALRLRRELATTWLDIAAEVQKAFLEVLGSRKRLALHLEAEGIAAELATITRHRVAAGELAATEAIRAEARKAEATTDTLQSQRRLAETEADLAVALQEPFPLSVATEADLVSTLPVPDLKTLLADLELSPILERARSETHVAAAELAREQASAWSDPTLSIAVREVPDKNARAFTIGFSVPLPLFQRNQAGIAEAGATMRSAAVAEEAAMRRIRAELMKTHAALAAVNQEARTLRDEVVVRTTEAAAAVQEGFREGKFRYSDVLESSQALVGAKNRHLDALLELHRTAIALDRLIGKPAFPEGRTITSSLNSGAHHE